MTFSRFLLDIAAPSFIVLGRTMSLRRRLLRLVALYHSRSVIYLTFLLPCARPCPTRAPAWAPARLSADRPRNGPHPRPPARRGHREPSPRPLRGLTDDSWRGRGRAPRRL